MLKYISTLCPVLIGTILFGQSNYMDESHLKYSTKSDSQYIQIDYVQINNYLAHTMSPDEIGSSVRRGTAWISASKFLKSDTLTTSAGKKYYSQVEYCEEYLYAIPYGKEQIENITRLELQNYLIATLSYSPLPMLQHFVDKGDYAMAHDTIHSISFTKTIGEYIVTVTINKANFEIEQISTLIATEEDDQFYGFGDVLDNYFYSENVTLDNVKIVPSLIIKDELNGKLSDTVIIESVGNGEVPKELIQPSPDFQITNDTIVEADITIEKYSDNIYFINLHHCGTRSLAVEFEDYFLVAEAPLNSRYGDQIIEEVSKINPEKPIKYFVFGHFHPHYTGGIRPFIHKSALILCLDQNQDYINSIAEAKHTIHPDSLALDPKEVAFESIFQAKTISDGSYYMTIYHIGKKSNHTNDYLIYYFPKEKLVFQDDLVWIDETTTKENISPLTTGFYQAVKDLNLDVTQVAQNWSVFNKSEKMIFDFSAIEKLCR